MRALSSLLHAFRAPLAVAAAASLSVGCGPEFEPASELRREIDGPLSVDLDTPDDLVYIETLTEAGTHAG